MAIPFLTVVIPTKGRADKLVHTLRTVTEQTNERFEVVISDNLSTDETQSLMSSITDPRIRYFRTDSRLSMCDNWEFALEQVRSDYVLYIGDDDGLMPGCIDILVSLLQARPCPIYYWPQSFYTWGSGPHPPSIIYVAAPRKSGELILRKAVEQAFKEGAARYMALPLLYHSLVSTRLLASIKNRTGRVFHSTNPDVFCGFALPVFSEKAFDVGQCLTLRGGSESGYYDLSESTSEPARKHAQFLKEYGEYRIHRGLDPTLPKALRAVPDSILVASDLFPEFYKGMSFNYEFWYAMNQRYWHFSTVRKIFQDRKRLAALHPFSAFRFLMYAFLYRVWGIFQKLRTIRRKNVGDLSALYGSRPEDVYICARLIADSLKQ
jgi:glycosyltransferase involved in cell wall biosynthesis